MANESGFELRWIFGVVRRWWWLIAGLALAAAGAAYAAAQYLPPVYETSATLMVNPSKSSTASQLNELMAGQQLAITFSQMIDDQPVLEEVISELGLAQSPAGLARQITANPVRDTQLIQVTVRDSDPEQAARIANALAQAFTRRVAELSALRYQNTINEAAQRVEDLRVQNEETQADIDRLYSEKAGKEAALADQQIRLAALQSDYRSLQDSYQKLELEAAGVTGQVYIVEPVQVQKSPLVAASTATAVVSMGQVQLIGGSSQAADRPALTYGSLIIKPALLQSVIDELGLSETTAQLSKKITYEVVPGTQLIRLNVTDVDENKARLIAESLVKAFVSQLKALLAEPYAGRLSAIQSQISEVEGSLERVRAEISSLNTETAQLAANLDRLDTSLTSSRSDYRAAVTNYEQAKRMAAESSDAVVLTEPAQVPAQPSQSKWLYISLAGLVGLAIGTGLAVLLRITDNRIWTSQDVRAALKLPVLGEVGRISGKNQDLVMGSAPDSRAAEDFRMLGHKIRLIIENKPIHTLLVTSPAPAEGKSVVVSNLAVSLSKMGLRTVVVDADLRLPRLHRLFGLGRDDGLAEMLYTGEFDGKTQCKQAGGADGNADEGVLPALAGMGAAQPILQLLQRGKEALARLGGASPAEPQDLHGSDGKDRVVSSLSGGDGRLPLKNPGPIKIVTSGKASPNPAELVSSPYLAELLQKLKEEADIVLIDCPPVLAAAETSLLAAKADAVLLVLRAGVSDTDSVSHALAALQQANANLIGAVLNGVRDLHHSYYRYYRRSKANHSQ